MKISVIVTVYSETELLRESVRQIRDQLREWPNEILIVVHPKSSPECMALCDELGREADIRVIIQGPRSGIGWAYREAIPYVTGTHALIMSSDLETNPADALIMSTFGRASSGVFCTSLNISLLWVKSMPKRSVQLLARAVCTSGLIDALKRGVFGNSDPVVDAAPTLISVYLASM